MGRQCAWSGKLVREWCRRITLNFLRWALAFLLLLPLAGWRAAARQPACGANWRRFAVLGLLGVGCYNALQYLALKTSTPINVTLVASSSPVWMLGIGALFFGAARHARQVVGALLSMAGVLLVLSRGELAAAVAHAAGARRPLRAAGHRRLGVLQLAADRGRGDPPRSAATGRPS